MNMEFSELATMPNKPVIEVVKFCDENNMEVVIEDGVISKFVSKEN